MLKPIWEALQHEIKRLQEIDGTLTVQTERSETTSGVQSYTLATAPLFANGAKGGDMIWISNGRKTGEGVGAGTGIVAYYNPNTNSYYRFADDTAALA